MGGRINDLRFIGLVTIFAFEAFLLSLCLSLARLAVSYFGQGTFDADALTDAMFEAPMLGVLSILSWALRRQPARWRHAANVTVVVGTAYGVMRISGGLFDNSYMILPLWFAIEVAVAAVLVTLLRAESVGIVREPSWSGRAVSALLGASPALSKSRRKISSTLLIQAGYCAYGFLGSYIVLLMPMLDSLRQGVLGWKDSLILVGMLLFFGAAARFVLWIARFLSQRLAVKSAEAALADDPRPPVLFLRRFTDDQVETRGRLVSPVRWLFDLGPPTRKLDIMLADEFLDSGPVVAIGDPKRRGRRLFGAARAFPLDDRPGEDKWRSVVAEFASRASAVVVCVQRDLGTDAEMGIDWEVRHLGQSGHIGKTLWLVHPTHRSHDENVRVWRTIGDLAGFDPDPIIKAAPVLGAFLDADGRWNIARSGRAQASAYLATMRWFFRMGLRRGRPEATQQVANP